MYVCVCICIYVIYVYVYEYICICICIYIEDHLLASGPIFLLDIFCVIFLSMKFVFHFRYLVTLTHRIREQC